MSVLINFMRDKTKSLLFTLLMISILLKTSFLYSKYIYYPVVFLSLIYSLYYLKFDPKKIIFSLKALIIIIIQIFLVGLAFIRTDTIYPELLKEGFNVIIMFTIGFIMISSIDNIKELDHFYISFLRVTIYTSFTIAIAGIIKFLLELRGIDLPIYFNNRYPFGSSLQPDYNFFSLVSIIGIVFIIYNIIERKIIINNLFQQFALFCLFSSAFLTASRRSLIILFVIICFLIFLLMQKKVNSLNVHFRKIPSGLIDSLKYFLIAFLLVLLTGAISLRFIKPESKNMISKSLGLKVSKCQYYSTALLYSLQSVIGSQDYPGIYSRLWLGSFDSRFPQSGWGNGDYSLVTNLDSCGLKDLPYDSKGIRLDKSANYYYWGRNSYYFSFLTHQKLKNDSKYTFEIYCYVSSDYDGNDVSLIEGYPGSPRKYITYNLTKKGTWQKLSLNSLGDNSIQNIFISFFKDSVPNFASLKGHIIFAYPTIDSLLVNPNEPKSWATIDFEEIYPLTGDNVGIVPEGSKGCLLDKSAKVYNISNPSSKYAYSYITFGDSLLRKGNKVSADVYCYVSPDYNGNTVMLMTENGIQTSVYNLLLRGSWQKLSLLIEGNNTKIPVLMYFAKFGVLDFIALKGYVVFAHPTYKIIRSGNLNTNDLSLFKIHQPYYNSAGLVDFNVFFNQTDKDLSNVRNTQESPYSLKFSLNYSQNDFAGPRYDYWRFGWYIYMNEYCMSQKIFGGGFDYMSQFGKEFSADSKVLDWPHNPFVSVLLYGGIVGLIAFLWLLSVTVYLYWLYRKESWAFLICFGIVFFFSFFSSNNPFDPPIMGFFIILPFFIHSVHKRDKSELKNI
jgi:hypothetical protein